MIVADTGVEPEDRDPTPVNSDGEEGAALADEGIDVVPDDVVSSSAAADPVSTDDRAGKRRRTVDLSSAPSGVLRTPNGLPVAAIAVTPGGVAIPLPASSLPAVGPPPRRDEVVSAVRRRGGLVSRRVRRRIGGSSEEGPRLSSQDVARPSSSPTAVPGPPSASSAAVGQASGSLPGALTRTAPVRRSTVGLPNSNTPANVFLRGPASSGSLANRLAEWFRDVRARRGP